MPKCFYTALSPPCCKYLQNLLFSTFVCFICFFTNKSIRTKYEHRGERSSSGKLDLRLMYPAPLVILANTNALHLHMKVSRFSIGTIPAYHRPYPTRATCRTPCAQRAGRCTCLGWCCRSSKRQVATAAPLLVRSDHEQS